MTLDLDELGRIASAATPGVWKADAASQHIWALLDGLVEVSVAEANTLGELTATQGVFNRNHIAAFDPPTALALIARARDAERLEKAVGQIGRRARSDGNRTFDECIRDLMLIDDLCRALSALNEGGPANG